jgi:DNA-binding MarR family transcriptional regulator
MAKAESPVTSLPHLPCACANLRRATRAVSQLYDEELRKVGLRGTQFALLQVIHGRGPLAQGQIGELLSLDSTTLSRTLRPLQRRGWIRWQAGEDKRERLWRLTSGGERKLLQARPYWHQAQARFRAQLGDGRWQQLQSLLLGVAVAAGEA